MAANYAAVDIKPGSMGLPLPGIEAGIVARTAERGVTEVTTPMTVGELALRPGWPSMFRGYLNEDERYRKCFVGGWYLCGDLAMRDADGYFWFVGRGDDVIKSSGHLIGPFEVESALMEHPAVAEAGVIGKPDLMAGEMVNSSQASPSATPCARNCWATRAGASARRSPRRRSTSAPISRRPAAARSCAAC